MNAIDAKVGQKNRSKKGTPVTVVGHKGDMVLGHKTSNIFSRCQRKMSATHRATSRVLSTTGAISDERIEFLGLDFREKDSAGNWAGRILTAPVGAPS